MTTEVERFFTPGFPDKLIPHKEVYDKRDNRAKVKNTTEFVNRPMMSQNIPKKIPSSKYIRPTFPRKNTKSSDPTTVPISTESITISKEIYDNLKEKYEDLEEKYETLKKVESTFINTIVKDLETNMIESINNTEILDMTTKPNNLIEIIKELVNSKSSDDVFRLSTMRILITYQGVMLNKEELFAYFTQRITSTGRIIDDYVIVHDKYEGTLNTHVYIKLNRALHSNKSNVFDVEGAPTSPNIERIRHKLWNIRPVLSYLFKCDPMPHTNLKRSDYSSSVGIVEEKIVTPT